LRTDRHRLLYRNVGRTPGQRPATAAMP
jgi:hypothetical protein